MIEAVTKLTEEILLRKPGLRTVLDRFGQVPVGSYLAGLYGAGPPGSAKPFAVFLKAVQQTAAEVLGEAAGSAVAEELARRPVVATADHHGPLSHYFFLHSHFLACAAVPNRAWHVVLATANVSLGNSSYPRGFVGTDASLPTRTVSLPVLPAALRQRPVFGLAPFSLADVRRLANSDRWERLAAPQPAREAVCERWLASPEVLGEPTYERQVTALNARVWRELWPPARSSRAELAYLPLERVVARCLEAAAADAALPMHDALFGSATRSKLLRAIDGVTGAHATVPHRGTELFWRLSRDGRRVPLYVEGEELLSADGSYALPLSPEPLATALRDGEIFANTALSLLTVAVDAGVTCTGGFSQTTYLPELRAAYESVFGSSPLSGAAASALGGDLLACYGLSGDRAYPLTALDALAPLDVPELTRRALGRSLSDTVVPIFPDLYRALVPAAERTEELASLSVGAVARSLGLI